MKKSNFSYGVDDLFKDKIANQGIVVGNYSFKEKKSEKGTGVFSGKVYSRWCVFNDSMTKVSYDDIDDFSDDYRNNAFIGVWRSYKSQKTKLCNWGDYRISMINNDFDIGACCFSPCDKYLDFGWNNYKKANFENNEQAKQLESIKWWK